MDDRVAALHALVQPRAFNHITGHQFSFSAFCGAGLLRFANQRPHGMAFCQQSPQHVFADKAGSAGEKDFHGLIVDGLILKN